METKQRENFTCIEKPLFSTNKFADTMKPLTFKEMMKKAKANDLTKNAFIRPPQEETVQLNDGELLNGKSQNKIPVDKSISDKLAYSQAMPDVSCLLNPAQCPPRPKLFTSTIVVKHRKQSKGNKKDRPGTIRKSVAKTVKHYNEDKNLEILHTKKRDLRTFEELQLEKRKLNLDNELSHRHIPKIESNENQKVLSQTTSFKKALLNPVLPSLKSQKQKDNKYKDLLPQEKTFTGKQNDIKSSSQKVNIPNDSNSAFQQGLLPSNSKDNKHSWPNASNSSKKKASNKDEKKKVQLKVPTAPIDQEKFYSKNYSSIIRNMFKYDASNYDMDNDDDIVETSTANIADEEHISKLAGHLEDKREEELEKARILAKKAKKMKQKSKITSS